MRPPQKAAIVLGVFIVVVWVLYMGVRPIPGFQELGPSKPCIIPSTLGTAGKTSEAVEIRSFLHSLDHYYPIDPSNFKHHENMTFFRYKYPNMEKAVFLSKPHYAWVTKYEAHVLPVFEKVAYGQPDCLVIDVGANDGIYTQLSAGAGCSVVSFELQDGCTEWLASSVMLNNLADRVRIVPLPVYSEETTITTKFVEGGCSGTYSLSPNSLNYKPKGIDVTFKTVVLSNIVPDSLPYISLLKVDVEGGDVGVVKGALPLFKSRRIKHLVVEIYAMMWSKPYAEEGFSVYHSILEYGYAVQCLGKYYLGNFPTEEVGDTPIFYFKDVSKFDALVRLEKTCVDWHFFLP